MRHRLLRWFLAAGLAFCGGLTTASADDTDFKNLHPNAGQGIVQPTAPTSADTGDKIEKAPPTFAYFMAVAAAVVVLCIICVPSRKGESSTSRS